MERRDGLTQASLYQELQDLREGIIQLGIQVQEALKQALEVLQTCNEEQAHILIDNDSAIDHLRNKLEEQATRLLTLHRPLADQNLRILVATFSIVRNLERIGDGAAGIAQNTLRLSFEEGKQRAFSQHPLDQTGYVSEASMVEGILQLGREAQRILRETMDAFIRQDSTIARHVWQEDDVVDVRYHMVRHDLMSTLRGLQALTALGQDNKMLERITHFLWMAHKLERVSDHCTNICEQIIFILEGQISITSPQDSFE